MSTPTFTAEPLSWRTGSEISGLDLSRTESIPEADIRALWQLLADRCILLFRNQSLSHDHHLAFTRRFGPLAATGLISRYAPEGYPDIFTVTNMKIDGVRSETYDAARKWHADQSFLANPARASMLYCAKAPRVGGNTLFANMYQAYDGLSQGLQSTLEGLSGFHTLFNSRAVSMKNRKPATEEEMQRLQGAVHPAVRVHPDSGRKCLFVSDEMVDHFDGWTVEESAPLLDYLYTFSTQPAFTYRHCWKPGDLVFWDNRCSMHLAPADYDMDALDAPENHRLMYRTTLA